MGRTPAGQTRERVFQFVRNRLLAGLPPTVREVQEKFGFRSVQTAREHLETLVEQKRLTKQKGRSRGYRLLIDSRIEAPPVLVPLVGQVQAGSLTAAIEEPDGYITVQTKRSPGQLFALRVEGRSMVGAGIFPQDVVIVRRQPTANSGEIVVALVDDEATVKRLRLRGKHGKRVELHPENPDFDVIVPNPDNLMLLGRVIEVRRYLDRS